MGVPVQRHAAACCLERTARVKHRRFLQHYNPVIDNAVKELLHLSGDYVLVAEMPFGGIVEEPAPKDKEEIESVFSLLADECTHTGLQEKERRSIDR